MVKTSPLVNRATNFLNEVSLSLGKVDLGRLKTDKDYFEKLYTTLRDNLEVLKELKDEMEIRSFDSPYFALGIKQYRTSYTKGGFRGEDVEDQRDIARHKKFFRANASFKKGTFERTKSSIASHNIAIGHLSEFIAIECKCGRVTRGKDVTKVIDKKGTFTCPKCGSGKVKLIENDQGVYRLELIPYLPFGGEFTVELSKFSPTERAAYRDIVGVLRKKEKGKIRSATIIFRTREKGKWVKKRDMIEVDKDSGMDYEGILREKYGRVMIENIRFHHERSILISGRYNRQILSIAYTKILRKHSEAILEFLMGKRVNVEKLKKYEALRRKLDSVVSTQRYPTFSIDTRIAEERMELIDEFEENLKEIGLMDERGNLDPELERAISYRQEIRKTMLFKIPLALFAWDVFKFLLIKPYRERRYASIFPGLQPVPEKEQLEAALGILSDEELVSAINTFIDKDVIVVEKGWEIFFNKFEIEEVLKDYLKVTSSRAVGGISLYIKSDMDLKDAARAVSTEPRELEEVLKILIRLGRKELIPDEKLDDLKEIRKIEISEKAKKFLELVR